MLELIGLPLEMFDRDAAKHLIHQGLQLRGETMSKRIRARVVAHWLVAYRHAHGQGEGLLLDLSLQGCQIKGVPPCSCGSRFRLQFWLPDQAQPMAVEQAVVRWTKDDQFGVSFLDVLPNTRARLAQVFEILHEAQHPKVR